MHYFSFILSTVLLLSCASTHKKSNKNKDESSTSKTQSFQHSNNSQSSSGSGSNKDSTIKDHESGNFLNITSSLQFESLKNTDVEYEIILENSANSSIELDIPFYIPHMSWAGNSGEFPGGGSCTQKIPANSSALLK